MKLLLITAHDSPRADETLRAILSVLPRGGAGVQLRAPGATASALLGRARAMRPICAELSAPLLVNERLDVALAAGADGAHLPARGISAGDARALWARASASGGHGARRDENGARRGPLIGASTHSLEEARRAAREGADYALFGPVWEVPDKGPARGLEALRAAASEVPIPLFALGGVTAENARQAIGHGARGVACIRFVFGASDPAAAAIALWQAVSTP